MLLWAAGACGIARAAECPAPTSEVVRIGSSTLCVLMRDAGPEQRDRWREWVGRSARIVAQYYGHFPASLVHIELDPTAGEEVGGGRTTMKTR